MLLLGVGDGIASKQTKPSVDFLHPTKSEEADMVTCVAFRTEPVIASQSAQFFSVVVAMM